MAVDRVEFRTAQDEYFQKVGEVGSIVLSPEATLHDWVLASISVLNRDKDGGTDIFELQSIIIDAVQYGLWENNKIAGKPVIDRKLNFIAIQKIVHEVEFDLTGTSDQNSLIKASYDFELTDLGKRALEAVVINDKALSANLDHERLGAAMSEDAGAGYSSGDGHSSISSRTSEDILRMFRATHPISESY